jgi:hypothetical protein
MELVSWCRRSLALRQLRAVRCMQNYRECVRILCIVLINFEELLTLGLKTPGPETGLRRNCCSFAMKVGN